MSNSRFVNGEPETIEVRLKTYFSLLDLLKYLRDLHSEGFDGIDSRALQSAANMYDELSEPWEQALDEAREVKA